MSPTNERLDDAEVATALGSLRGWTHADDRLRCSFAFDGFPAAITFMTRVAFEAERLDHHPNWSNVYHRVDVELWSHDLGGVSRRCLELAAAMNRVAEHMSPPA